MIKTGKIRITVDKRGKIKTGKKSESGFPVALDYFNVEKFPELAAAYGEKPEKFIVFTPTNEIEDAFDDTFALYKGHDKGAIKIRSCDGETCTHIFDETIDGTKYGAGEETGCVCENMPERVPDPSKPDKDKPNPDRCKYGAYLKVYIGMPPYFKVDNAACYLFETHSQNSGDAIKSELTKVHALTAGKLFKIPFILSVKKVSHPEKKNVKFPIWHLQMHGLLSDLRTDRLLSEGIEEAVVEPEALTEPAFVDVLLQELTDAETNNTLANLDKWLTLRQADLIVAEGKLTEEQLAHVRQRYRAVKLKIEGPKP